MLRYLVLPAVLIVSVTAELQTIDINLDSPPELRWFEVGKTFSKEIRAMIPLFVSDIPAEVQTIINGSSWLWQYTQPDYLGEIQGLLNGVNSVAEDGASLDLNAGVLVNVVYELGSWCTGVIAKMQNGTIIHARNMDFDHTQNLRDNQFIARFWKNGKP